MIADGWYDNESIDAALDRARTTGKAVLLDFWSPTCTGCAKMLKTTYTEPRVQTFLREWFVPVKFNTTKSPEKFRELNGRTLHMWHPHLVVADNGLREARRIVGRLSPDSFIAHMCLGLGTIALSRREYPQARDHFSLASGLTVPGDVTAEALYWLGVAEYRLGGTVFHLDRVWSDLASRFPNSDWTERADCLDVDIPSEGFDPNDLLSISMTVHAT